MNKNILGEISQYLICKNSANFVVSSLFFFNFRGLGSKTKNINFSDSEFPTCNSATTKTVHTEMRQSIYWKVIGKLYSSGYLLFYIFIFISFFVT